MFKKIIPVVLLMCLLSVMSATAEDTKNTENPSTSSTEMSSNENFDPSMAPPGDFDPSKMPQDFDPSKMPQDFDPSKMPANMGGFPGNMQNHSQGTQMPQDVGFIGFVKTYSTPITSLVLLAFAYLFVCLYKRKHY